MEMSHDMHGKDLKVAKLHREEELRTEERPDGGGAGRGGLVT